MKIGIIGIHKMIDWITLVAVIAAYVFIFFIAIRNDDKQRKIEHHRDIIMSGLLRGRYDGG